MSWPRRVGLAAGALVGLGAGVVAGALVEAHAFVVRRYQVPVLPAGQPPIRVLHISDLHLLAGQRDKLEFLRGLAGLQPDLVISTGDHLSQAEALTPMLHALAPLLDLPGAFVFGSNDFVAPTPVNPMRYLVHSSRAPQRSVKLPWRDTRDRLLSSGWVDLNDKSAVLEVAGRRVDLRGTSDAHRNLDVYDAVAGPLDAAADITLGVTHAPYRRVLDAMTADGIPMIFAGHTHGGQVCLPVNRAIVTNCDLPTRFASGLHQWTAGGHTSWFHVSAGLGTSPYAPYRLFCRPEVSLLTLTALGSDA